MSIPNTMQTARPEARDHDDAPAANAWSRGADLRRRRRKRVSLSMVASTAAGPQGAASAAVYGPIGGGASVWAGRVAERAAYLEPADREFLLALYLHGRTMREMAQLLGVSYRRVRTRCKALVARVMQPAYAFVAVHRDAWTPTMKAVATRTILHGRSLNQAAAELKVTYHTVRSLRDRVLAMASGAAQQAKGR